MKNCQARGVAFVGTVELGAELEVAAFFWTRVGRVGGVGVGVTRGVERGAVRHVVRVQGIGLVQRAKAVAPVGNGLFVVGRNGAAGGQVVVGGAHAVKAQTAQQLPVGGDLQQVLCIQPKRVGPEGAGECFGARGFINCRTIVHSANRGGRFGNRRQVVDLLALGRPIDPRQHFVAQAQCGELVAVVALRVAGIQVLHFVVVAAGQHGGAVHGVQCHQRGGARGVANHAGGGVDRALAKANGAGALVARVAAGAYGGF